MRASVPTLNHNTTLMRPTGPFAPIPADLHPLLRSCRFYFASFRVFRAVAACSQPGTCPRTCVRGLWAKKQFPEISFAGIRVISAVDACSHPGTCPRTFVRGKRAKFSGPSVCSVCSVVDFLFYVSGEAGNGPLRATAPTQRIYIRCYIPVVFFRVLSCFSRANRASRTACSPTASTCAGATRCGRRRSRVCR